MSLFCDLVSAEDKKEMVNKLFSFHEVKISSNRHSSNFGKPILPQVSDTSKLSSFIGASSWNFFHHLVINMDFLHISVENWSSSCSYQDAKQIIHNLSVVNDRAERGVKLASDYLSAAHIESRYQNILQIVENDRKRIPNIRKRKKSMESWFLTL